MRRRNRPASSGPLPPLVLSGRSRPETFTAAFGAARRDGHVGYPTLSGRPAQGRLDAAVDGVAL
jgi:hypothetical protein